MAPVTILMATSNAAAYLSQQLASFAAQTHEDWALWASDDGSGDNTRELLQDFARANPTRDIRILEGPRRGGAANFLSLLRHPDLRRSAVAFSDQDDVWHKDRLAKGLRMVDTTRPKLACGTSRLIDHTGQPIRYSAPQKVPSFSFENALVQNIVAGNTVTLNPAACDLLRADPDPGAVPFHDWWLYLRLTAGGIDIAHDPEPCIDWRQHSANTLGHRRKGRHSRRTRLRQMWDGTWAGWVQDNLQALLALPDGSIDTQARNKAEALASGMPRLRALRTSGAHRTTRFETGFVTVLSALGRF